MFIAILSDTHDNEERTALALDAIRARGISRGFHLGDFVAPFMIEQLAASGIAWECVWGNNDGDQLANYVTAAGTAVDLAPRDFREIEVEGKRLLLTHYPDIARIAALSGQYDAAFHGHTHIAKQETVEGKDGKMCLLANPGAVHRPREGAPRFGIYDTEGNTLEHVEIA